MAGASARGPAGEVYSDGDGCQQSGHPRNESSQSVTPPHTGPLPNETPQAIAPQHASARYIPASYQYTAVPQSSASTQQATPSQYAARAPGYQPGSRVQRDPPYVDGLVERPDSNYAPSTALQNGPTQQLGSSFQRLGSSLQRLGSSLQHPDPIFQQLGPSLQHSAPSLQQRAPSFQSSGSSSQRPHPPLKRPGSSLQQPGPCHRPAVFPQLASIQHAPVPSTSTQPMALLGSGAFQSASYQPSTVQPGSSQTAIISYPLTPTATDPYPLVPYPPPPTAAAPYIPPSPRIPSAPPQTIVGIYAPHQPDDVQYGFQQHGLFHPASTQNDPFQYGSFQHSYLQHGTPQLGPSGHGTFQQWAFQNGVPQHEASQHAPTQYGTLQNGAFQHGASWNGSSQNGPSQPWSFDYDPLPGGHSQYGLSQYASSQHGPAPNGLSPNGSSPHDSPQSGPQHDYFQHRSSQSSLGQYPSLQPDGPWYTSHAASPMAHSPMTHSPTAHSPMAPSPLSLTSTADERHESQLYQQASLRNNISPSDAEQFTTYRRVPRRLGSPLYRAHPEPVNAIPPSDLTHPAPNTDAAVPMSAEDYLTHYTALEQFLRAEIDPAELLARFSDADDRYLHASEILYSHNQNVLTALERIQASTAAGTRTRTTGAVIEVLTRRSAMLRSAMITARHRRNQAHALLIAMHERSQELISDYERFGAEMSRLYALRESAESRLNSSGEQLEVYRVRSAGVAALDAGTAGQGIDMNSAAARGGAPPGFVPEGWQPDGYVGNGLGEIDREIGFINQIFGVLSRIIEFCACEGWQPNGHRLEEVGLWDEWSFSDGDFDDDWLD